MQMRVADVHQEVCSLITSSFRRQFAVLAAKAPPSWASVQMLFMVDSYLPRCCISCHTYVRPGFGADALHGGPIPACLLCQLQLLL